MKTKQLAERLLEHVLRKSRDGKRAIVSLNRQETFPIALHIRRHGQYPSPKLDHDMSAERIAELKTAIEEILNNKARRNPRLGAMMRNAPAILLMHYGVISEGHTYAQLGARFGCSRSRLQQIEYGAMVTLSKHPAMKTLLRRIIEEDRLKSMQTRLQEGDLRHLRINEGRAIKAY